MGSKLLLLQICKTTYQYMYFVQWLLEVLCEFDQMQVSVGSPAGRDHRLNASCGVLVVPFA